MLLRVASAVFVLVSLAAVPVASGQTKETTPAQPQLPVSLARIREGLKKSDSKLTPPARQADFRVDVAEEQRFRDLVDLLDFSAGPSLPAVRFGGSQTQPLFNVNMTGVGQAVISGIAKARRERAERIAQEEVERAFLQFCSTHECAAR